MNEIEAGGAELRDALVQRIAATNRHQFDDFFAKLRAKFFRYIDSLTVTPLYGDEQKFGSVSDALNSVSTPAMSAGGGAFRGFDVIVTYSNGDTLRANFASRADAESFLFHLSN